MDTESHRLDESSLWRKLNRHGKTAGRSVVLKALELFYALMSPATPAWAKTVIVSALIYFISPIDAIPDILPGIGYTDDLGVLAGALVTVAASITPEVKRRAAEKLSAWFSTTDEPR